MLPLKNFRVSSDFWYQQNIELGDKLNKKGSKFPWHSSNSDSLELELFVDPDEMIFFSEAFSLHSFDEPPMMLQPESIFEFAGGKHLEILITPSVMISDDSLRTFHPFDRSCYFEDEMSLKFFKIYTKHNCEIECFSNYVLKTCNCVTFDIIRDPHSKVCGVTDEDIFCSFDLLSSFRNHVLEENVSCVCLPTCDSITYNFEIRETKLREDE